MTQNCTIPLTVLMCVYNGSQYLREAVESILSQTWEDFEFLLYNDHRVYRDVASAANIPIIGMGGVQDTRDAVEFFLAGASAIAVGTALFLDPTIPLKIADGLSAYVRQRGLRHVSELTGGLKLPT